MNSLFNNNQFKNKSVNNTEEQVQQFNSINNQSLNEYTTHNKKSINKELNRLVSIVSKIEKTKQKIVDDLGKYKRASNNKVSNLEKIVIKFYNFLTDIISVLEMEDGDKVQHMEDIVSKMKSNKQFMADITHILQLEEDNNSNELKEPDAIDVITSNTGKSQYTSSSVKKHLKNFNINQAIKEINQFHI